MSGTNVPVPTFVSTGFIAPAESAILSGVTLDMNAAFGGNLNFTNLETPQGQLASSQAAIIGDCYDQFTFLTSQMDPAFSSGRFQDGIGRIYFITRNPAVATAVQCNCLGLQGVVIPSGSLAQDVSGNLYSCSQTGTIASNGTISLPFQCTIPGPIACPVAAIGPTPYQTIPGWDSVTNPAAGVVGQNVESRSAFEARRQQSVAQNSSNTLVSLIGSVLSLPGVISAYGVENTAPAPVVLGDYTLAPNSMLIVVSGGIAASIAQVIFSKKPPGCSYNGNTTVNITLTTGYVAPYPTYAVTFCIPTPVTISFIVTLANNSLVPSNYLALVQAAIVNAFSGGDGGPQATIAGTIYASRFYAPIAALGPWVNILSIVVSNGIGQSGSSVTMNVDQVPVTATGSVTASLM